MQSEFVPMDKELRKTYYMAKRERFNDLKVNGNESVNIEKAALMIFLNKTCFNGLFRVNRKGLFNVPMGSYKNPLICDELNLRAVSDKLQNVEIICGDYRKSSDFIDENTFVYFDPPYRPITDTASFTAYTENLFDDEDQIKLAQFVDDMHRKGAKIVISNFVLYIRFQLGTAASFSGIWFIHNDRLLPVLAFVFDNKRIKHKRVQLQKSCINSDCMCFNTRSNHTKFNNSFFTGFGNIHYQKEGQSHINKHCSLRTSCGNIYTV